MPPTVTYGLPLKKSVRVGPAEVAYIEEGDASLPPVLLLHGLMTHGILWQKLMKLTSGRIHALAPDLLGLGDTEVSPYEDLGMPAQAEMLLGFLDRLGIGEVTLVAHDHGGAAAQILAANHPERVRHLLLVDTVSGDHWPIPLMQQAIRLARLPGTAELFRALALMRASDRARLLATGPLGYARGYANPDLLDGTLVREYLRPFTTPEGRERARRFLLAADTRSTVEILPRLRHFDRPTRIAWGADDRFLSPSWGMQLADLLPTATFALVPFCGHFAPDERPEIIARHLLELLEE